MRASASRRALASAARASVSRATIRGLGAGEASSQSRLDSNPCREIDPFTPRKPEALACCYEIRISGGRLGDVRELRQTEVSALGLAPGVLVRSDPGSFGRLFSCLAPRGFILCAAAAGFFGCGPAVLLCREILERGADAASGGASRGAGVPANR